MVSVKPLTTDEIALQLHPEHRLFAQTFVMTRGDRARSMASMNRPCPTTAIKTRSAKLLERPDIRRYIYGLLQADTKALDEMRGIPEWRDFVDTIMRLGGSGELDNQFMDTSPPEEASVPILAAKGASAVAVDVNETQPIDRLSAIQTFWYDTTFDALQPMQQRLKASELYARSLGAFDPNQNKNSVRPLHFVSTKFFQSEVTTKDDTQNG